MKKTLCIVSALALAGGIWMVSTVSNAQPSCCGATIDGLPATCSPTGTCNACKNCKYCGHCAKRGGTCSVCR